jgi:hypothetical protein
MLGCPACRSGGQPSGCQHRPGPTAWMGRQVEPLQRHPQRDPRQPRWQMSHQLLTPKLDALLQVRSHTHALTVAHPCVCVPLSYCVIASSVTICVRLWSMGSLKRKRVEAAGAALQVVALPAAVHGCTKAGGGRRGAAGTSPAAHAGLGQCDTGSMEALMGGDWRLQLWVRETFPWGEAEGCKRTAERGRNEDSYRHASTVGHSCSGAPAPTMHDGG